MSGGPLSEHEQRQLEQIEQALYADYPTLAQSVRATDPKGLRGIVRKWRLRIMDVLAVIWKEFRSLPSAPKRSFAVCKRRSVSLRETPWVNKLLWAAAVSVATLVVLYVISELGLLVVFTAGLPGTGGGPVPARLFDVVGDVSLAAGLVLAFMWTLWLFNPQLDALAKRIYRSSGKRGLRAPTRHRMHGNTKLVRPSGFSRMAWALLMTVAAVGATVAAVAIAVWELPNRIRHQK